MKKKTQTKAMRKNEQNEEEFFFFHKIPAFFSVCVEDLKMQNSGNICPPCWVLINCNCLGGLNAGFGPIWRGAQPAHIWSILVS